MVPGALASPALDTPVRGRATRGVCPSASGWFRLAHVFETCPHCRVRPTVMPSHGRIAPIRLWTGPWVLRLRAAVNGAAADRAGRCLRPSGRAPEGGPCVLRWLSAQPLEETPGRCPHRSQPFPAPPPAVRGAPASSLTRLVSRPLVLVGVRLAHGFRHPTPLTSGISVSGGKIYLARLSAKKKVCVDISYPDNTVRRRKARDASHRGP